jgi:hypothetical protein
MKIKTILTVISFIAAFTFAATFVKLSSNQFSPKNNPQAQEKIYNFLLKEQQINLEMFEKAKQTEMENSLEVWKKYKEEKFKLDTAGLPEDFRNAWEKRISSEIDWINFFSYFRKTDPKMILKTDAQIEIFEQKDADYSRASHNFEQVIKSYGIGYDKNGELIKK